MKIRDIPFQDIDLTDNTYGLTRCATGTPAAALRLSVQSVGILHPPILRQRRNQIYQVVAGRQRLQLAEKELGWSSCPCLVLDVDVPEERVFEVLLEESLAGRSFTVAEEAVFLWKASNHLGKKRAAQKFLSRLGRSPHPRQIDRLVELLQLEVPLLDSLQAGRLDEAASRAMLVLSPADRSLLHEVITTLKLGVGKQRKLVTGCRELAMRHECSIVELFQQSDLRDILNQPETNLPQRASALMSWLIRMLQPKLNTAERSFRHLVDSLHLPANVDLTHTPAFEKDGLSLTVNLRDETELQEVWTALRPLLKKKD